MPDRVEQLMTALTLDEKIALLAGRDLWSTVPIPRLGIPSVRMTDGPNGVRGSDDNHGPPSTGFPVGVALGATFDPALARAVGRALAQQARTAGASVLLGPTVNIPRVPHAGRNFECFSEDPVLSGTVAAAYVDGVQSEGVAACLKHVVCNDQETDRETISAIVDDRALHEVYLEPFRIAVRAGRPWAAMSAYNGINGTPAAEHPLLDEVLRDQHGFDGLVVSDWYGTYSPSVLPGGLDLEMPGPARWMAPEHVHTALASGAVTHADIDRKVRHLLTLIDRTSGLGPAAEPAPEDGAEEPTHRDLARRAAAASIVLLTNDGTLPLTAPRRVAVIGEHARRTPREGGGSSQIHGHPTTSILDGLRAALGPAAEVEWSYGCAAYARPPAAEVDELRSGGGSGLLVEYYDGAEPSGTPVRTAVARRSRLGFFGPGDRWVDYDRFAVRMSGQYVPSATGVHAFSGSATGRVRIWLASEFVVDAWTPGDHELAWEVPLEAGRAVELVIEFASTPGAVWREVHVGISPPRPSDPIREAVAAARSAEVAIVAVGLSAEWESEGFDRQDLRLPGDQDALVAAVAAAQPNTIVVLTSGSPVELPWLDDVAAVVQAWYGGQEIGHAIADVLLGQQDPGGRLPITWPVHSRQHPGYLCFPGENGRVRYGEGVYVGYRAFDRLGLAPLFEFGHGGSYTTFELEDVLAEVESGNVRVRGVLSNAGDRDGTEVVQVFARDIGDVDRRLVGFLRLSVDAGGRAAVDIHIDRARFAFWDAARTRWTSVEGPVGLEVRGTFGQRAVEVDLGPRDVRGSGAS